MVECFYIATMVFIKLSLGIFFMRVTVVKWHKGFTTAVLALSTVFGVAFLMFAIFQCSVLPSSKVFAQRMLAGKCATRTSGLVMNYLHATITAMTDCMCGILPLFIVKQSRMPFRAKLVVVLLLIVAAV
jgi:hypothetical protein